MHPPNPPQNTQRSIYAAAARIADAAERLAYLEASCGDNREMLQRVLAMLDATNADVENPLDRFSEQANLLTGQPGGDTWDAESQVEFRPGASIGPYRLIEGIGEGGMGVVYRARQTKPIERTVAVKIIKPGMDSRQVISRFEAERRTLALMDHPNIARVLDAGRTPRGRPYFVMELVDGLPITKFCWQENLTLEQKLNLFIDVCRAVHHAHQKGIIHRDLKPGNLLVAKPDESAIVKVIDFGVAKAIDHEHQDRTRLTAITHVVGTPTYMSPEQTEPGSSDIDTRSDVYALGVTLYELLTGTTPITHQEIERLGDDEVRRLIRESDPPRPSARISTLADTELSTQAGVPATEPHQLNNQLKGELDWIVMKTLEKDRDRRYDSAQALADDVQRYLDDLPVMACPPSTSYRLKKLVQRHRVAIVTFALVFASLVTGTVVSVWQAIEANSARNLADHRYQSEQEARRQAQRQERLADQERQYTRAMLYVSDMKLASDALRVGDIARVSALVQRHRPKPGETDLRDFVWHYLDRCVRAEKRWSITTMPGLWAAKPSPDGTHIAVASAGQVLIYNLSSLELAEHHVALTEFRDVAWSPDGRRIAAVAWDGKVRVWRFESATTAATSAASEIDLPPELTFHAHDGGTLSVCFSIDGNTIFTGGFDDMIRSWDALDGGLIREMPGHGREIMMLDPSPDGKSLASASADDTFSIWTISTGKRHKTWKSPSDGIFWCVKYSDDGKRLVAGDNDGNLCMADIATGKMATARQLDSIYDVTFLNESNRIAACDRSGAVRVWSWLIDPKHGPSLESNFNASWQAGKDRARSVVVVDEEILVGCRDGNVSRWRPKQDLDALTDKADDFDLANDGTIIVVGDRLTRYSPADHSMIDSMAKQDPPWYVVSTAASSGRAVLGGYDGTVAVWDLDQQEKLAQWKFEGKAHVVGISPDGSTVAVGWYDEQPFINLLDVSGSSPHRRLVAQTVRSLDITADADRIAVGNLDDVLVYDLATDQLVHQLIGHTGAMSDVTISPKGRYFATISHDRRLKLWDAASGLELRSAQAHLMNGKSVRFSNDGKLLVTGGVDGFVKIWNVESLQPMLEIDIGEVVFKAEFTLDDMQLLVLHGSENRISIYDVRPDPSENKERAESPTTK